MANYNDINNTTSTTRQTRTFNHGQISILTRSMLNAGIGFILIALIGLGISLCLTNLLTVTQINTSITILWIASILLILVAMIVSMVANTKFFVNMGQVKKSLLVSMWAIYVIAEGAGFGVLFTAFYAHFGQNMGVIYLSLIFAAGGVAFLICAAIGKSLSVKQTISFGKFVGYMSIGFMAIFFICMIVCIVMAFIPNAPSFVTTNLYVLIIGISTLLFLFYMIFDVAVISKTQQFINIDDRQISWNASMIFGFRLLVDLVGLVWNLAILVLRFAR